MALTDLWEALIAFAAVGVVVMVVMAKIIKNNPKIGEWLAQFNPSKLYDKVSIVPETKDKMEQVYEDRRRLV